VHRLAELTTALLNDAEGTRRRLSVPGLVWEPVEGQDAEEWERTSEARVGEPPAVGGPLVALVKKEPGRKNAFLMGITVGRVATNDVVVAHTSVSRFHAFLQHDEALGAWTVADAESKNGTWLEGRRLAARERVLLSDGVSLRFGEVRFYFLLPDSLLELVRRGEPPRR